MVNKRNQGSSYDSSFKIGVKPDKMLNNKKRVFWEALLLTLVVFILGLLLGITFENKKLQEVNEYYLQSEISLMDILALNSLIGLEDSSCDELIQSNIDLADRIYDEALLLEKYEASGKLTGGLRLAHEKYDVLRTFLWINTIKTSEKCEGGFDTVIYLYEYEPKDLTKKARQNVWSKILFDLKQERGNEILLIPIAANPELASLNFFIENLDISETPVVIVNNEFVISELNSIEDVEMYL